MPLTKLSRRYHLLKKAKSKSNNQKEDDFNKENQVVEPATFNPQNHHPNRKGNISIIPETSSSSENGSQEKLNIDTILQSELKANSLHKKDEDLDSPSNMNCECCKMKSKRHSQGLHLKNGSKIQQNIDINGELSAATGKNYIHNDITECSEISYMDCQNWKRFESTHIDHLAGTKEDNLSCFTEDFSKILQVIDESTDSAKESNDESYHSVQEEASANYQKVSQHDCNTTEKENSFINAKISPKHTTNYGKECAYSSKLFDHKALLSLEKGRCSKLLPSDRRVEDNSFKILASESEENDSSSLLSGSPREKKYSSIDIIPQNFDHSQLKNITNFQNNLVPATNSNRRRSSEKRRNVRRSMLGKNEVVLLSSESDSSLDDSRCTNRSKCCWKKHFLKLAPLPNQPNKIDYNCFERSQQEPYNQPATSSNTCAQNLLSKSRLANIKQWIEVSPFGPQKSQRDSISKVKVIDLSSSGSENDLSDAQENKNSHSKMLDNSADHNVDCNFFSYGTSKQDMPHSSDVSSKNILVGQKFSGLIDCTTPDDEIASLKNDITTFSEVIPHIDLKNNNQTSTPYLNTTDKYKDNLIARNKDNHTINCHNTDRHVNEESPHQNDNTYSEDRRTSKDQLELSSSFDDSGKGVSKNKEPNSIYSQYMNTKDLRKLNESHQLLSNNDHVNHYNDKESSIYFEGKLRERTLLETDENKGLPRCDKNINKEYPSRLDKENQAALSENSEDSNYGSPLKISVCLQASLTDNDSCITDQVFDKSLNIQDNINCSSSEKYRSRHSLESSNEEFNSINLLQDLAKPSQSCIAIQHNGSPTQELNLILSSDSDEKSSSLDLDKFENRNIVAGRTNPSHSRSPKRHSKEKNIFGNYRYLSDEDDHQIDSTLGNENLVSNPERDPSGCRIHKSFEEFNDKTTTKTSINQTNQRLDINKENHNITTSKLVDESSASLIQTYDYDEKSNNLTDKSTQVTNAKGDKNYLRLSDSQDFGIAIAKNELIATSQNHDHSKMYNGYVLRKPEESLKTDDIVSKNADQNNLRNSIKTSKLPNSNKQSILLDCVPTLDAFVIDQENTLSFLSSLSLDEPNKRYYRTNSNEVRLIDGNV